MISARLRLVMIPVALAIAACGGDESSGAREATSAAEARRQAAATRQALTDALDTYKSGDHAAAEEQVAEAYVQHFEDVEHALEAKDAELKETLEERIGGDLRDQMKRKAPPAEVQQAVDALTADLEKAEALLR
jgi:biopolymer transport protein ExbB/TolQ